MVGEAVETPQHREQHDPADHDTDCGDTAKDDSAPSSEQLTSYS
jgi:hypothetical protein